MSIEFKLPAVGENIDTAEIGGLRVAVGDTIAADQIVMEIETDKAVFELPCPTAGKVTKIHVKPGDTVQTGAALLTLDESAWAAGGQSAPPAAPEKQVVPAPSDAANAAAPAPSPNKMQLPRSL
jgi:pyruvate dehydrogenase E2 component (dihydrolipoamide acetyltransferase)